MFTNLSKGTPSTVPEVTEKDITIIDEPSSTPQNTTLHQTNDVEKLKELGNINDFDNVQKISLADYEKEAQRISCAIGDDGMVKPKKSSLNPFAKMMTASKA